MKKQERSATQQEAEEAAIELERSEKLERLLSGWIKDEAKLAEAELALARADFQRSQRLAKVGAFSKVELDATEARANQAEAVVKRFKLLLAVMPAKPEDGTPNK